MAHTAGPVASCKECREAVAVLKSSPRPAERIQARRTLRDHRLQREIAFQLRIQAPRAFPRSVDL